MYKITVFVCSALFFSPIITQSQRKSQESTYELEYKRPSRGLAKERRFIFGVDAGLGAITALGPNSPIYTTGIFSLKLGALIPMVNNLTLDLRVQAGFPLNNFEGFIGKILPLLFQSSITVGFYLGLGGRVYNNLYEGRGWVIFAGGGITLDFGLRSYFASGRAFTQSETLYQMLRIGGELNARFAYYFHPRAAVSLRAYLNFAYAPFAGDPFYSNFDPLEVGFAQMSFGAGVGLLF